MIVSGEHARAIHAGQVTEHRLPAPSGWDPARGDWTPDGNRPLRRKRLVTIGSPAAVYCRAEVTSCFRSVRGHHSTLQTRDVHGRPVDDPRILRRLGHDSIESYVRAWLLARDTDWLARRAAGQHPSVLNAALAAIAAPDRLAVMHPAGDLPDVDAALMGRWYERWAYAPVWVVTWTVHADAPRFLARTGGTTYQGADGAHWTIVDDGTDTLADHGYTDRADEALPGAGEAVDTTLLNPDWEADSRAEHIKAIDPRDRLKLLRRHAARLDA